MNKQRSNEMGSIRKKLLAAVAMLLVACVMTVSSTYAWFTLSTAPEVKGITTTVGANGNLEIALGYYDTVYGSIVPGSAEGDSMAKQTADRANITWGNLVDLSGEGYGLQAIKLYPTRLNAAGNQISSVFSPLSYPKYGSDGRITELDSNTLLGQYADTGAFLGQGTPNYAGVNAIGSASSMSEREFAVRNNKLAIETNRVSAKASAQYAINNYSGELAGLAIANQNSDDATVLTATSIESLNALIVKLEESNAYIAASIKSAFMLVVASGEFGLTDDQWKLAVSTIGTKNLDETLAYVKGELGITTLPSQVEEPIAKYNAIAEKLARAKSGLQTAAADDNYTWGEVKGVVSSLLNYEHISICGKTVGELKSDPSARNEVIQKVGQGAEIIFTFGKESGIFADIAEMIGEYRATLAFPDRIKDVPEYEVEGIALDGWKKPVDVESPSANTTSGDLGVISVALAGYEAPSTNVGGNTSQTLTDTYGYTLDLLFRTNASDSYLQLQTVGANRIYAGNDKNADLQGEGSNMTFVIDSEYTQDKIKNLAEGIRVVFYETGSAAGGAANILGVATLDTATGTVTGNNYKLNLVLQDYSFSEKGVFSTNGAKLDNANTTVNESCALTALSANTVKKITVLVYLDGDVIDNGDIGVAAELNGKLNLQFSSSAALDPMDNNDLLNGAN